MSPFHPHFLFMKQAPYFLLLLLLGLLHSVTSAHAQVTLSQGQVGNVDAGQFTVFWQVDDTVSQPGLDIFSDAAATASLQGELGVEFFPLEMNDVTVGQTAAQREARRSLQTLIRGKGIVLAKVTGAEPGMTYYVRPRSYNVATGLTNETASAPLIEITTPASTDFVIESRQVRVSTGGCFAGSQGLVMRMVKVGAPYPLFAVVGDHEETDKALFDVNRFLNVGGTTNESFNGTPSFELELLGSSAPQGVFYLDLPFAGEFVVASTTEADFSANFPGLAYFSLEAVGSPLQGVPFTFNITARDSGGNALTAFNGKVELTTGDPADLVSGSGETAHFVNGVLTGHQVVTAVSGPVTFTATRLCGIETGSQVFNFSPPNLDISFSAPVYAANQGATSVTLTLVRTATVPASVVVRLQDGTAQTTNPPFAAAVSAVDYLNLDVATQMVDFAENETSKEVVLTLYPKTPTNTPNKRFSASLHAPAEGAEIAGAITSAQIHILANDTVLPKLTVTSPAANTSVINQLMPYQLVGRASDARGIARVEYVLNGGHPVAVVLDPAARPTAVPFVAEIEPVVGLNSLQVIAYDMRGNSVTVSRTFTFIRRYLLTVTRSVPAAVDATPDLAGTVTLAGERGNFAALAPRGAKVQNGSAVPGTTVTLTAKPASSGAYSFSHWQGLPGGAVQQGKVVFFEMPAQDVTTIQAVYILNPFLGLGTRSQLHGLLQADSADDEPSNANHGSMTATLTSKTGVLSGKVYVDGKMLSFTGSAHGDGSVWLKQGKLLLSEVPLDAGRTFGLSMQAGVLHATLADAAAGVSTGQAYQVATAAAAGLLTGAGLGAKGIFTLALPAKAQTPGRSLSDYPQGTGYGSVTLDNKGILKVTGVLADGTKYTAATALVTGGVSPLHAQLLTPGTTKVKGGSLHGNLVFDLSEAHSDVSGPGMKWFRPAVSQIAGTTAAALATQIYTSGWPDGIELDALGAIYRGTQTVQNTLGLGPVDAALGNAKLYFDAGKLTGPVEVDAFNINNSAVVKLDTRDRSFTLSFVQSTGMMKGTFTPNWANPSAKLPAFNGVLLQKGDNRGGYGYFHSNISGDTDPESGSVMVEAP